MDTGDKLAFGGFGFMVALAITVLAAWVTHVIWIISTLASDVGATVGQTVLGAIGAFMPPIGAIHGVMIWLGMGL